MTKGADSIMEPRVKWTNDLAQVQADLYSFALDGLRTLMMAQRELNEQEYQAFETKYHTLLTSSDLNKDDQLAKLFDDMENNLTYVGCSAIEDKL
jgi:phospholipid-translocating ATPase